MSRLLATAKLLRGGGLPRLRVARDGLAAVRLAAAAAWRGGGVHGRPRRGGWRCRAVPRADRRSMSRLLATAKLLRGGGLPRLRVARDGLAAVRLAVAAAGLSTGVLESLRDGPADT